MLSGVFDLTGVLCCQVCLTWQVCCVVRCFWPDRCVVLTWQVCYVVRCVLTWQVCCVVRCVWPERCAMLSGVLTWQVCCVVRCGDVPSDVGPGRGRGSGWSPHPGGKKGRASPRPRSLQAWLHQHAQPLQGTGMYLLPVTQIHTHDLELLNACYLVYKKMWHRYVLITCHRCALNRWQ